MGGEADPGAPDGAMTGVPFGPITRGVVPVEPGGARIGCPSGPTRGVAPAAEVGKPFDPIGFSVVGGSAEIGWASSPGARGAAGEKKPEEAPV